MDYFTKWVEAKEVATITVNKITCFLWKNVFYGFGILRNIILDNGRQFDSNHY